MHTTKNRKILFKDIGLSYFGMGKLEKALEASNVSLSEKQDYVEALTLKGKSLRELERYDEALVVLDKALTRNSKHRDAQYQKGKV